MSGAEGLADENQWYFRYMPASRLSTEGRSWQPMTHFGHLTR